MAHQGQEYILSDDETEVHQVGSVISEKPLFPLDKKELLDVAWNLMKSGIPTAISHFGGFLTGVLCMSFIGKYGTPEELAGTTLGFTWSNIFCLGITLSLNQGFGVHAAQLYGAQKHQELGILLQRNLCIISLVMLPLLLSLYFADIILISMGMNYEVSINTGKFMRGVMPALVGLSYFDCLRSYLMAQNYFQIQPIIECSMSVVHIFWCYFFVVYLGMSVSGVAIAKSITDVSCFVLLWAYVKYKEGCIVSWIPWHKESLEKWWPHLKKTATIGANYYLEWLAYEFSLFIVGTLNDQYVLAAHGVAISLISLFSMMPLGNSISMQAYLGNAIGEGSKNKAQKIALAGIAINSIISLMNMVIISVFLDSIPDFFTNDSTTKEIIKNILLIYLIAHFADTMLYHTTGILRSIGKEVEVVRTFIYAFCMIALNCEWIFGVALGFGYPGVWFSFIFGIYLMSFFMTRKLLNLDWDFEIAKIKDNVEACGSGHEESTMYMEMTEI